VTLLALLLLLLLPPRLHGNGDSKKCLLPGLCCVCWVSHVDMEMDPIFGEGQK
jgi:hypothetical protein